MMRSVFSKMLQVGRVTALTLGVAIMLALVFGVASTALSKNGQSLILGKGNNVATKVTGLIGKVASGPAFLVKNPKGGSGLEVRVNAGQAPLTVNADAGKATNLDADKLDGKSEADFYAAGSQVADSAHADQADNADTLDNKNSSEFLGTTQKAADADKLDNLNSTDFQRANAPAGGDLSGTYPNPSLANGVVDPANIGPIPTARVAHGGNVTVPSGQFVILPFVQSYDVGNLWVSANPSRLTAPVNGVYLISAQATFEGNQTGYRGMRLVKNGGNPDSPLAMTQISPAPGVGTIHPILTQVKLSAGDYVEVGVRHNSGEDLTVFGDINRQFQMTWIAPG